MQHFKRPSRLVPVLCFAAGVVYATLVVASITSLDRDRFQPLAVDVPTTPRDCAIRTVYHYAQDDWGQRALIASAVLNASVPNVGTPCEAPLLPADVGDIPDPYRLQASIDAVDAVARGSYELPRACDGVTAFSPPEAAPRSQCVYGDLAFTSVETR